MVLESLAPTRDRRELTVSDEVRATDHALDALLASAQLRLDVRIHGVCPKDSGTVSVVSFPGASKVRCRARERTQRSTSADSPLPLTFFVSATSPFG